MLNILSFVGMSMQHELCLWTLLGLLRTIFDATLFKVNANLKQVWQMSMPAELPLPVQSMLRTMISGVMLVHCFTVYLYLASYIVLLYPVFLEERPTLVLPWLLLAAIRKYLCELTSLALGLAVCVLIGPARPQCIKFVVIKVVSIIPAFYMWMLVFSYYHSLKMVSAFKTFPAVLKSSDHDYGLELAVRRRRTKSLLDEDQLCRKLVDNINYGTRQTVIDGTSHRPMKDVSSRTVLVASDTVISDNSNEKKNIIIQQPFSNIAAPERLLSDIGSYEDWFGSEAVIPRDTDRIMEQFVLMMLRICAYLKTGETDPTVQFSQSRVILPINNNLDCSGLPGEDTPPQVGNSQARTASYLQEYPQIFLKKLPDSSLQFTEQKFGTLATINSQYENKNNYPLNDKRWMTTAEKISPGAGKEKHRKSISVSEEANLKILKRKLSNHITPTRKVKPKALSSPKNLTRKDVHFKHKTKTKQEETEIKLKTESVDSLQSIIDRMRSSLNNLTESRNSKINPPTSSQDANITHSKGSPKHRTIENESTNTYPEDPALVKQKTENSQGNYCKK